VKIQDGADRGDFTVRQVSGDERAEWFERGVAAYPPYADYVVSASGHGLEIPVFVATPA